MHRFSYARHRFPPAIIQHAVWLYFRFALSYRDVEDMLAERGIDVSYETVRRWALKFGRIYAERIRRRRPRPSDRWHLDEVFLKIGGKTVYLWRAVDDEGEVLDILVQSKRDRKAALKLLRKLLKRQGYVPDAIVTDRLRSTAPPCASSAWPIATSPAGARTTGQRFRISRPDAESGSKFGSSRPDRHSASSPPTPPSPTTSTSNAI